MKIIQQLAEWLIRTERLSPERYADVCRLISGMEEANVDDGANRLCQEREEREKCEDLNVAWWDLHGAGIRPGLKECSPRKTGRRKVPGAVPIKVWDLEPKLPNILMGGGSDFKLPVLLLAVAAADGQRFGGDWRGFSDCVSFLYGLDAERLHDSLRSAIIKDAKKLAPPLLSMEGGDFLFPPDFLKGYSGQSVSNIQKRITGDDHEFECRKANWILKYPNFNTLNEACVVRNRIRRIFRLWVVEGVTIAEKVRNADHPYPTDVMQIDFGNATIEVPFAPWFKLHGNGSPIPNGGTLVKLRRDAASKLNEEIQIDVCVDASARIMDSIPSIVLSLDLKEKYEHELETLDFVYRSTPMKRKERDTKKQCIEEKYERMRKRLSGVKTVSVGNMNVEAVYDGSDWRIDLSGMIGVIADYKVGYALVWKRKSSMKKP